MSLYLGEAILSHGPIRAQAHFDPDCFGTLVGEAFVRWRHDPLTPATAPGNTCLAGARRFERDRNWQTSGIRTSDGCGAVMRIVPLALAWQGETLLEAARISAAVTHAHPNALEAAMAGAWLLRQILETGTWSGGMVAQAACYLEGVWCQGGQVAASLRAALAWADLAAGFRAGGREGRPDPRRLGFGGLPDGGDPRRRLGYRGDSVGLA